MASPRYLQISRYGWEQDPQTTIVGAGWDASAPLTSLFLPQPQRGCLTVGNTADLTITLSGGPQSIGLIHFQNLHTSNQATIGINAGGLGIGPVNAWATDANGVYPQLEWNALGRQRIFVLPQPMMIDQIGIQITDIQPFALGYVGVCEMWQSPVNMSYDWQIVPKDLSDVTRIPFGSVYPTQRGKYRQLQLGVEFLRQDGIYGEGVGDEVFSQPLAFTLFNGHSAPMIAVPFPDDTANLERSSVWGGQSQDPPFANYFFATWKFTLTLDQWI